MFVYEEFIDDSDENVSLKKYTKALKFFEIDERAPLKEIDRLKRLYLKQYDI